MGRLIYFTGGMRSGKSKLAEKFITEHKYNNKFYLATSLAFDEEMEDRIKKHQIQRGDTWTTIEEFENIILALKKNLKNEDGVILFDCVNNFVSNKLLFTFKFEDKFSKQYINEIEEKILNELLQIIIFLKDLKNYDTIIVSNEVGLSLVPTNKLGRTFVDILGKCNQLIVDNSDEAFFVVSGQKIRLK